MVDRLTEIKARVAELRARTPERLWWLSDLEFCLAEIEEIDADNTVIGEMMAALNTEVVRLRDLLREADQCVKHCCQCIEFENSDLQQRIDAALEESK